MEPSNEDKMTILMSKIKLLGQEYIGSPHCFPVGNYILYIFDSFFYLHRCTCFSILFVYAHFRFSGKTIGNKSMQVQSI